MRLKSWQCTTDDVGDYIANAGDSKEPWNVLQALLDGEKWNIDGEHVVAGNPDFVAPDGTPNVVCNTIDLIHLLILIRRSANREEEFTQDLLDDLSRVEKERDELNSRWKAMANHIERLPELLPWKFQPARLKR